MSTMWGYLECHGRCSVLLGDIMINVRVFLSTVGGYHEYHGGYLRVYRVGYSVHIVCTISFERPVNYLCDAWHVFPPKYEAWTHFNN